MTPPVSGGVPEQGLRDALVMTRLESVTAI
jgi:hypothetical protein